MWTSLTPLSSRAQLAQCVEGAFLSVGGVWFCCGKEELEVSLPDFPSLRHISFKRKWRRWSELIHRDSTRLESQNSLYRYFAKKQFYSSYGVLYVFSDLSPLYYSPIQRFQKEFTNTWACFHRQVKRSVMTNTPNGRHEFDLRSNNLLGVSESKSSIWPSPRTRGDR